MTTPQPASPEPMPGPQEIPAAFQPNGHSPSQMVLALMQQMPALIAQAFASVLQQVPVRTTGERYRCAQCVMGRLGWLGVHRAEADTANATYMQAVTEQAGLPDEDPRKSIPLDFIRFLPEHLRPGGEQGMPPIAEGMVLISGTAWCMEHVPGAPGKSQLVVATAGMSPAMLAGLAA